MKKRLLLLIGIFCFLFSAVGFAYTDGIRYVCLNLNNYLALKNSFVSEKMLTCESGSAEYEIYIPFYSDSVDFLGEPDKSFEFAVNENTYKIDFDDKGTANLNFGSAFKPDSYNIIVSASQKVTVKEIKFNKENAAMPTQFESTFPKLTEYESALQTAVAIKKESPVVFVNGSTRYIDYNNPSETVFIFNGTMYLPINTAARALGYYYEDIPQKSYALMRYNNTEYIIREGSIYKKIKNAEEEKTSSYVLYREGKTWVPLRYFAEETGKNVIYKNGIAVIDYSRYISLIMQNEIFEALENEFKPYITEEKRSGNIYHVAKSEIASDENDGSAEFPFLTLKKASETAVSGDTVIIHEGTYREILKPKNDGTAVNPITFKAAEGETVTISANEVVKDFYIDSGKILCAKAWDLGLGRNMVFYKGEALPEARHPNVNTSQRYQPKELPKFFMTMGNIVNSSEDSLKFVSDTDLNQPEDFWKGGIFVGLANGGWYPETGKIVASKAGEITVGDHTDVWFEEGDFTDCGYITGTKNAIDIAGEWYVDSRGYVYMIPPAGENMITLEIEMKKRQLTIDLTDRKNIIIEGIKTIGGGITMKNGDMCILNNNEMRYISHFTFAQSQLRGEFDRSYDCISSGENGIYIDGENNAVVNSKIDYSAGYALYLLGKYTYVENNEIANCGYIGRGGIYMSQNPNETIETVCGGHYIYSNEIYNANREAISLCAYEPWFYSEGKLPSVLSVEIAYNNIYNASLFARDSGSIYMHGTVLGSDRRYTKIHHNYVHDTGNYDSFYADIYLDNLCQYGEVYDNIIYSKDEKTVRNNPVYIQNHPYYIENGSFAYGKQWDNTDLGYLENGIYDFDFYAGRLTTEFLNNYEKYMN